VPLFAFTYFGNNWQQATANRLIWSQQKANESSLEANSGGMAERLKAPVLKTGDPQGSVGSNPTPSAIPFLEQYLEKSAFFMAKMDGY
jgi:hypothetical protein